MLIILAILIALAILGPLFGADSRDGRDWARRRFPDRDEPPRSADSPAPAAGAHAAAERRRTTPATC